MFNLITENLCYIKMNIKFENMQFFKYVVTPQLNIKTRHLYACNYVVVPTYNILYAIMFYTLNIK